MEMIDAKNLISKMKASWPNIYTNSDGERIQLYVNCLIDYPRELATAKIDQLISSRKNYPSIAELKEYMNIGQDQNKVSNYCNSCDDTGWKFTSNEGHGTVIKCECGRLD